MVDSRPLPTPDAIRVLHLIKSLGRGGAEMLLPEMLKVHDRSTFLLSYAYFLPWKNQLVGLLTAQHADVTCFRADSNLGMLFRIPAVIKFIRREKIDILHCHLPWAGVCGRVVHLITGIPVVYTEHNKQERYHPLTRWLNLLTLAWNTHVVAVSDDVAASIRLFKGARFPVIVIKNGVDTDKFVPNGLTRKNAKTELGISSDAIIVGNVCVFRKQKRLQEWLNVAASLCCNHIRLRFLLVGDGPERENVNRSISELRLEDHVSCVGLQNDVRSFLAAMDIFMITSEFEGLPIALLEAMAMEKAVVSTRAGGIPEAIEHSVSGLLVPVEDPSLCADQVNRLLENPMLAEQLGKAARRSVINEFSIQKAVKRMEELYGPIGRLTRYPEFSGPAQAVLNRLGDGVHQEG